MAINPQPIVSGIHGSIPSMQKIREHYTLTALNAIDNLSADTTLLGAPGEGKQYALFGLAAMTNDSAGAHFSGGVRSGSASPGSIDLTSVMCSMSGPQYPVFDIPILCGDNNKIYWDAGNSPSAESTPLNLVALYYTVVDV